MSEMLPLFPLSTVLFPGMRLPLHIFEERYRLLAARLLELPEPRRFGVIAIRQGREVGEDGVTALYEVGCVATIKQIVPHADGRYDLAAVGTQRFRLRHLDDSLPYFQGEIEPLPDEDPAGAVGQSPGGATPAATAGQPPDSVTPAATAGDATPPAAAGEVPGGVLGRASRRVQAGFRAYLNALADRGGSVISVADLPDEPVLLSYVVGAAMIIDLPERQSLLAAPTTLDRLRRERSLLVRETAMLRATTSRPAPDFAYEQFSQN